MHPLYHLMAPGSFHTGNRSGRRPARMQTEALVDAAPASTSARLLLDLGARRFPTASHEVLLAGCLSRHCRDNLNAASGRRPHLLRGWTCPVDPLPQSCRPGPRGHPLLLMHKVRPSTTLPGKVFNSENLVGVAVLVWFTFGPFSI